jgi:hypothetical protein
VPRRGARLQVDDDRRTDAEGHQAAVGHVEEAGGEAGERVLAVGLVDVAEDVEAGLDLADASEQVLTARVDAAPRPVSESVRRAVG